MDMSLEERIAASNPGRRLPGRRDGGNGVRKNTGGRRGRQQPRKDRSELDTTSALDNGGAWTHDKWEPNDDIIDDGEEAEEQRPQKSRGRNRPGNGFKVNISNLHEEVGLEELESVFSEPGGLRQARIIWHRDRSTGKAFAIYETYEQASAAVRQFNGQLAKGQAITVRHDQDRSLESRITYPPRSLGPTPANVDRYVPDGAPRSREPRQPRERREFAGPDRERNVRREPGRTRGGRQQRGEQPQRPKADSRKKVRKTAEELDKEMEDYFGQNNDEGSAAPEQASTTTNKPLTMDEDVEMEI